MLAEQTIEKPSFESVWALLQENALQMKEFRESQRETDRIIKESQKESERFQKEAAENQREAVERQKEMDRLDRQMKESKDYLDRKLGSLTNLFGDFTLGMVAPKLREKFSDYGLVFHKSTREVEVTDK